MGCLALVHHSRLGYLTQFFLLKLCAFKHHMLIPKYLLVALIHSVKEFISPSLIFHTH